MQVTREALPCAATHPVDQHQHQTDPCGLNGDAPVIVEAYTAAINIADRCRRL